MTFGNPGTGRSDMRCEDDLGQCPERMILRQRLDLEYVQRRPGNLSLLDGSSQRIKLHDGPPANVDQVSRVLHLCKLLAAKPALRLRSVRCRDHHKIARRE